MPPIIQTYIYTTSGRQRPIFLPVSGTVRFVLSLQEEDAGKVQTTCDPPENIRKGAAVWENYVGGLEGAAQQVTAIRAWLLRNNGWAQLVVNEERATHGKK